MKCLWTTALAGIFALTTLSSCKREGESVTSANAPVGSQQNAAFNRGFHKEEVTPTATLRWAHQDCGFALTVPAAGNYRLAFKPITVFSPTPVVIEVTVNGQAAGSVTAQGFDFAKAPVSKLEVPLRAGANEIGLKADRPDVPFGGNDSRTAAFGLIIPVGVEQLP